MLGVNEQLLLIECIGTVLSVAGYVVYVTSLKNHHSRSRIAGAAILMAGFAVSAIAESRYVPHPMCENPKWLPNPYQLALAVSTKLLSGITLLTCVHSFAISNSKIGSDARYIAVAAFVWTWGVYAYMQSWHDDHWDSSRALVAGFSAMLMICGILLTSSIQQFATILVGLAFAGVAITGSLV